MKITIKINNEEVKINSRSVALTKNDKDRTLIKVLSLSDPSIYDRFVRCMFDDSMIDVEIYEGDNRTFNNKELLYSCDARVIGVSEETGRYTELTMMVMSKKRRVLNG
jgi:hypothetical protein